MGDGRGLRGFSRPIARAAEAAVKTYGHGFDRDAFARPVREAIATAPKCQGREVVLKHYGSDHFIDEVVLAAILS
jgi:hypothetical protein